MKVAEIYSTTVKSVEVYKADNKLHIEEQQKHRYWLGKDARGKKLSRKIEPVTIENGHKNKKK